MKLPDWWWKVPRPVRRVVCEVVCFAMFLLMLVLFPVLNVLPAIGQVFDGFVEAYHEWQFGRCHIGLRERYSARGKSIEPL